jgi:hypothetical protein
VVVVHSIFGHLVVVHSIFGHILVQLCLITSNVMTFFFKDPLMDFFFLYITLTPTKFQQTINVLSFDDQK